ncbi:hypothetical protein [Pseudocolwellia agarivorans]|uniref:hypothetical protein n=1 Tax=Pseudocolwellia agarivorans TaxID=1911682 RepID=UPI000986CB6A|nr:hypothetical protein [Pseudocolwellia agarivorans]
MSKITTNLYSSGKAKNGFCIDDNGTAWVNVNMLNPAVSLITAAFDGVPFTNINSTPFVCAEWAKVELTQAFQNDDKTLHVINSFFNVIENERLKVMGVNHAKH